MKGTSKVIMGATLIMVVTLALVLGLILVLLAELYCSLLLRRCRSRLPTTTTTSAADRANASSPSQTSYPPFTSIYTHGVLQAPRTFLFPTVSSEPNKHHSHQLGHFIPIQTQLASSNASPHHPIGLVDSASSSPPQKPLHHQGSVTATSPRYISNPIFENDERKSISGSSSGDDDDDVAASESRSGSPPLFPMKKLPAEASSVSLIRDATTSLGTSGSGSDSHSVNVISSSFSASPSTTSPSW